MKNNFLILCFFFVLMGCSSDDKQVDIEYKNVFESNNTLPFTEASARTDSKIDKVKNLVLRICINKVLSVYIH